MSIKNILIPALTFGAGMLITKLIEDDRHQKSGAGTSAATLRPAPSTGPSDGPSVLTENGKPVTQWVKIEKEDRIKKLVLPYLGGDYYIKEINVDFFDGNVKMFTNDGKVFFGAMETLRTQ